MKNRELAPIAVVAFNRPDHLKRTLDALAADLLAGQSAVTIFCDGPRNDAEREKTDAVRSVARGAKGFASVRVVERERNLSCGPAVITALTEMFAEHERLIVIEDDVLCSPHTLTFLNVGLERYEAYKSVFNISAWSMPSKTFPVPQNYPYDVYAIPRFNCWGWATWRDRFDLVDWTVDDYSFFKNSRILRDAFDLGGEDMVSMLDAQMEGKINSWAIRMDYARFKYGCVGINPVYSYVTNIGMGVGTHTSAATARFDNDFSGCLPVGRDFSWLDHMVVYEVLRKRYSRGMAPTSCLKKYCHFLKAKLRPCKKFLFKHLFTKIV